LVNIGDAAATYTLTLSAPVQGLSHLREERRSMCGHAPGGQ
jgi:hypothetical protein